MNVPNGQDQLILMDYIIFKTLCISCKSFEWLIFFLIVNLKHQIVEMFGECKWIERIVEGEDAYIRKKLLFAINFCN
jgi:hypothetical protein